MEQSWLEKGFILTWPDLRSHQFRVGGQYSGALLVQVYSGHGGDIINVIVIPTYNENNVFSENPFEIRIKHYN